MTSVTLSGASPSLVTVTGTAAAAAAGGDRREDRRVGVEHRRRVALERLRAVRGVGERVEVRRAADADRVALGEVVLHAVLGGREHRGEVDLAEAELALIVVAARRPDADDVLDVEADDPRTVNLLIMCVTSACATAVSGDEPRRAPQTAHPMSICAETQRGSVRSMMISHALLSDAVVDVSACLNSRWWLWMYTGPRPASIERFPRRFSSCVAFRRRRACCTRRRRRGGRTADVVLAEDPGRDDLVVPVRLAHVAMPAGEADSVLVAERAQRQQALRC